MGVLNWDSPNPQRKAQKDIQTLQKILKTFFQIDDSPINQYKLKIGYVTKFKIKDSSYRKR